MMSFFEIKQNLMFADVEGQPPQPEGAILI